MMGGQSSKSSGGSARLPFQMGTHSQYSSDFSAYESACKQDLDLQLFDTTIQQRTNRVITSLASGVEVRAISFDSLREVTDNLLEMNQDVVKVFLECEEDMWKNKEIFSLVNEYFEYSVHTVEFCSSLENCLRRTRDKQLFIQVALKYFEEEKENGSDGTRYAKTLRELKRYKEAGDTFTKEFFELFQSVFRQQALLFQKLQLQKRKLDKKLKSLKTWRRVSNVIFVAAFISVLIFSVVAAAIAAPPLVTALAGALAVPIGSVGKWCNSLFQGYEKSLKAQKEIISSMQVGTFITLKDLDSLHALVDKMEVQITSISEIAEFALRDEDAIKLVMDEIKKKMEAFAETINDLSKQTAKCVTEVSTARAVITKKIIAQRN